MEQCPQPAGFFNDGGVCSLRYPFVLFYGNKVNSVTEVASCFQLEYMQNYTKHANKAKTERRPVTALTGYRILVSTILILMSLMSICCSFDTTCRRDRRVNVSFFAVRFHKNEIHICILSHFK